MFLEPSSVLRHLPVFPGQRVADFGSGNGLYTFLIAERLQGDGAVYAFDSNAEAIESVCRECARQSRTNIHALCANLEENIPLKDALLDSAVIINTLHAIDNRSRFLDELHRTLKDGSTVLFVEWAASFNNMGPTKERAIAPGEAVRLFRAHGFSPGAMLPSGSHHFAFVAAKT